MKLYYVRLKSLAEYESYLNYDIIEKKYSFFDKEELTLLKPNTQKMKLVIYLLISVKIIGKL